MPLAEQLRPKSFDDMIGQEHLVGPNGILRGLANKKIPQSVIFYGPPGTGKTTAALIFAEALEKPLYKLNATNASISDIKHIVDAEKENEPVVYLDEIQYFNKKQQQSLLPFVEAGTITLIAATTENPYHSIYDALLSRCSVMEFKRPSASEILELLKAYEKEPNSAIAKTSENVLRLIANISSGDVRRALTDLELITNLFDDNSKITEEDIRNIKPSASMAGFDMRDDNHYAYISALQKSIRGSDPDAAVFWLSKMLEGGDIISPCRRLPAICCEDIGLAYPEAITHTMACCKAAEVLGLPEAYKPLTQAVILLAIAPKSCTNEATWMAARDDIRNGLGATVPRHLASEYAPGYLWAHQFPNHWVPQQYLPDDLLGRKYYEPGDNAFEQQFKNYWNSIKR
jgi:putative ATPase